MLQSLQGIDQPSHDQDILQQSWVEIATIMKCCNATLFGSKEKTTELIRSGEYMGILQQLQPILASWREKFQSLDGNFPPNYDAFLMYQSAEVFQNYPFD